MKNIRWQPNAEENSLIEGMRMGKPSTGFVRDAVTLLDAIIRDEARRMRPIRPEWWAGIERDSDDDEFLDWLASLSLAQRKALEWMIKRKKG